MYSIPIYLELLVLIIYVASINWYILTYRIKTGQRKIYSILEPINLTLIWKDCCNLLINYTQTSLSVNFLLQIHNTPAILRISRYGVPTAVLHDADHVTFGPGFTFEVRTAVVSAGGRPDGVGQAAEASLRHMEWRWHVRARRANMWRLHVLRAHSGFDAA